MLAAHMLRAITKPFNSWTNFHSSPQICAGDRHPLYKCPLKQLCTCHKL
uniref:Molybdopterin biosynthesis CNX3 protein n=1 Tax=Arundo donax TaxID=35708 RepID=A0A0A9ACR0_ARUDO